MMIVLRKFQLLFIFAHVSYFADFSELHSHLQKRGELIERKLGIANQ